MSLVFNYLSDFNFIIELYIKCNILAPYCVFVIM